jgi:hypothetical protein
MANVSLTLPPDYWKNFTPGKKDLEFISTYLFENETPLTEKELVPVLVQEHVRLEREALLKQQQGSGKPYLPKENYRTGDQIVFPALNWKQGTVVGTRPGVNPGLGEFSVIEVEFENGKKSFTSGLADHKLNTPVEVTVDDVNLDPATILKSFGSDFEHKLLISLREDSDLVRIAGRWFPRALLVDVNVGHLNLAEAVMEEAGGKSLSASTLIEQLELPSNVNPKLIEFSMNYALQEDPRFDEVGPAGEVLWCLKRLEPEDVQQIPAPLRYNSMEYDSSVLTPQMLKLVAEIDDELTESPAPAAAVDEVTIALTYPHWRAGTLPVSARVQSLFPTAYESPRVLFTLVDGLTGEEIPAWVVRQHGYVCGLSRFYKKYELFPGSLVVVKKGKKPGQAIITAKARRPVRDWVRTVLVGSDGGIVFATLKQNLASEFNERMVIAVTDVVAVDEAAALLAKKRVPLEQIVADMMRELIKMNVQGHVHAQELYSALNIVRRCPPAPLLAILAGDKTYKHVGDMHFRMAEAEAEDE